MIGRSLNIPKWVKAQVHVYFTQYGMGELDGKTVSDRYLDAADIQGER